jgi:glutaconate CoA-transferase subunit A
MCLRLHAGALGIPFIPAATLLTGDMPLRPEISVPRVCCPFTGQRLAAIPALNPDVAIVHAQRADQEGNVQMWGVLGDTVDGANASGKIIVTVEEIVPSVVVRQSANRTILPAYRVDAVCEVPFGAHPSYVHSYYDRDDQFFLGYDEIARTVEGLRRYIDEWIAGPQDWRGFLAMLGDERLKGLRGRVLDAHLRHPHG